MGSINKRMVVMVVTNSETRIYSSSQSDLVKT